MAATKFRKRKSIRPKPKKKPKPFTGITDSNIRSIITALFSAFLSEDPHHYGDPDGGNWGPALGFAANRAKIHNENIRKLQTICRKELKRRLIKQVGRMFETRDIKMPGPGY